MNEDAIAEHTVLLEYQFALHGGREEVVRVRSQLVLPLALKFEKLAQTDVSFPDLVVQVIFRPLMAKFRPFLQRRFDAASKAEAEAKAAAEPPALVSARFKLPGPGDGKPMVVPEDKDTRPVPRPPGDIGSESICADRASRRRSFIAVNPGPIVDAFGVNRVGTTHSTALLVPHPVA